MERRELGNRRSFKKDALNKDSEEVDINPMPPGEIPSWIEQTIWTERMVAILRNGGPQGGKWYSLQDKVFSTNALSAGFTRVKANRGAPGVDHKSVEQFDRNLVMEIQALQTAWQEKKYLPQAVRRTWIPKPGSTDQRPLGIPTVRDRVVQAALKLVLEPIFEQEFHRNSYGFRPKRGAKDAMTQVVKHLYGDRRIVVDVDLKAYFDSIPHERLLEEVRKKVSDGRILELIEMFLKANIMEGMHYYTPEEGTPQGGVVSPLLANIYLNPLDWHMSALGYEMIRYADDFVVLCRTQEEAEQVLSELQAWTQAAGLTLHPTKTRIVDMNVHQAFFDFLGYRIMRHDKQPGKTRYLRLVRPTSLSKIRDRIRQKTPRNYGRSLNELIFSLNLTLKGWHKYFRSVHESVHEQLDQFIRRRIRSIQACRHGHARHGKGIANQRWPNAFFAKLGLFSLKEAHRSYRDSCRG